MPSFNAAKASAGIDIPADFDFAPLSALDLRDISSELIESYLYDLYDNKGVRGGKFSRYKDVILQVFEYAKASGYISEIPPIELRTKAHVNQYKKPDADALRLLLSQSKGMPAETIIRLSWECGLQRGEISALRYSQIDFEHAGIVLADRRVPLSSEMQSFLAELKEDNYDFSDYVLLTQKKTAPMAEPSISRLVRTELDKYGQAELRLADLRFDYIVRQLQKCSIEYVSYISGVDIRTLQKQYLPYVGTVSDVELRSAPDYDSFYQLMLSEKDSVCALALCFAWQLGIKATELPALKWVMVDFERAEINGIHIPEELLSLLRGIKEKNGKYSEYIFITESTKKPLSRERISHIVKQTLVQKGIFNIGLKELSRDYSPELETGKKAVFDYLSECVCADREQIANALGYDERASERLLKRLRNSGEIVLIGREYYLRGTVVSPEEQHTAICDFLAEHPLATRKELCDMLGLVNRRQLLPIIKPLIDEGLLLRTADQRYRLAEVNVLALAQA